jgi:hypothetical protein
MISPIVDGPGHHCRVQGILRALSFTTTSEVPVFPGKAFAGLMDEGAFLKADAVGIIDYLWRAARTSPRI